MARGKDHSSMIYRQAGESCVYRGIVNDQVWSARSVIVVKDGPTGTVLLLTPGAQCAFPAGYWHWRKDRDAQYGTRWQTAASGQFDLRRFAWSTNRILIFLEGEKYYSCWPYWEAASDQFKGYYINYELPFKRSPCGFDTLDLDLDIVIDPQYHWEWKDEAEYREGIRTGGIKPEWAWGIEQAHAEVFERIARRSPPLDGSWVDWRPDPAWAAPSLLDGWEEV
jgi:hypothetical protein